MTEPKVLHALLHACLDAQANGIPLPAAVDAAALAAEHLWHATPHAERVPPTRSEPIEFGHGWRIVDTGRFDSQSAVFISMAKQPGEIGASSKRENIPPHTLAEGDVVLTFPTDEQAQSVADALVGKLPERVPSGSAIEAAREFVATWHLPQRVTNNLAAALTAAAQSAREEAAVNIAKLQEMLGAAYQVIGALAHYTGTFDNEDVIRALDAFSDPDSSANVDLLPWPKGEIVTAFAQSSRNAALTEAAEWHDEQNEDFRILTGECSLHHKLSAAHFRSLITTKGKGT